MPRDITVYNNNNNILKECRTSAPLMILHYLSDTFAHAYGTTTLVRCMSQQEESTEAALRVCWRMRIMLLRMYVASGYNTFFYENCRHQNIFDFCFRNLKQDSKNQKPGKKCNISH